MNATRAVVLLFAACGTSGHVAADAAEVDGPCPLLEGHTFASVTEGECGLGPNGPEPCTWHLTFSAESAMQSHFEWQHSDYGESGKVVCRGTTVTGTGASTYAGQFANAVLTWDGVDYTVSN